MNHPGVVLLVRVRVRCGACISGTVGQWDEERCGVLVQNKKEAMGARDAGGRVGGDDGKGGRGKQSVRWGRETGGRRARGVERRLAEHQELSVVLGRALLFSMSQLEFTYSVMVDDLVTTQKKTGYKLAMWWLARKTEAMSLEKVGTPKLERRVEGGGGRGEGA